MKRIQFEGDAGLCAKWLPFAKSKMDSLSKLYAGRRNWVWETILGDVRIGLERNGNIEYIRIKALTGGYEFATAFSAPPTGALKDVKFGLVRLRKDEDNVLGLEQRDRSGKLFTPENDTLAKQLDAYLYGRDWGNRLDEGKNYITPRIDWFSVPLVDTGDVDEDEAEIARRRERGYSGSKWGTLTPADSRRYTNVTGQYSYVAAVGASSYYNQVAYDYLAYSIAADETVLHRKGKKSKPISVLGNQLFSTAVQNGFLLGGIDRGELYKFFAYHLETEAYFDIDLAVIKPAWLWGTSRTRWYWRGDGKRCISLQYDAYSSDPDKLYLSQVVQDVTLHELEFELNGVTSGGALSGVIRNKFSTRNHGVHPVAIDYDFFDPTVRRVLVLEPWIGPQYDMLTEYEDQAFPTPSRALLVYACFCTVSDTGVISAPYRRIPVYHKPWLVTADPDDYAVPPPAPILDEFGYLITERCTHQGVQEFFDVFGYHGFSARIAALDMRSEAIAIYSQVQTENYPGGFRVVDYTYKHNKHWRIWDEAEDRENLWIEDNGAAFTGDDPLAAIATPPAGYVRFTTGHALYIPWIISSEINYVYEEITRSQHPQGRKQMIYDGFRSSPDKNFALFVQEGSDFYTHKYYFTWQVQAIPEAVKSFIHFDHVEWFRRDGEGNPDPVISTHLELFNAARGTDYEHPDEEVVSMCANGFWGK